MRTPATLAAAAVEIWPCTERGVGGAAPRGRDRVGAPAVADRRRGWQGVQLSGWTLEPFATSVAPLAATIHMRVTVEGEFHPRDLGNAGDSRLWGAWIGFDARATPPR